MIEKINISNYALIIHSNIEMEKGFTVITGETGAGKSILLGAIGLNLGQRADSSVIMDKSKKCISEITYNIEKYNLRGWFDENQLDYADSTIVRREISPEGKSRSFINDTPVNNKTLKEFGLALVDIHSQHQSLLIGKPEYQLDILDTFSGTNEHLEKYQIIYRQHQKLKNHITELKNKASEAEKESDYLKFQLSQLENAQLKNGEEKDLEEELQVLNNAENIKRSLSEVTWSIRDTDSSILNTLRTLKNSLSNIEESFNEAKSYKERIESVLLELSDLADTCEYQSEDINYDPAYIDTLNTRLNTINELLFKYKKESVSELIEIKEQISKQLQSIDGSSDEIEKLEKELASLFSDMQKTASEIRELRKQSKDKLSQEMKELLTNLGIKHAEFVIELMELDTYTLNGSEDVKFLFSANKNQQLGELAKVASGGEISRVMLSLKYILSQSKQLPVIVFDEIDTGVSGEVAHRMAQMMQRMAENMQVISISHLPQIAAAGNCHFKVYKEDNEQTTVSQIKKLSYEERIKDLAAMMSGDTMTDAAIEAARRLLQA